MNPRFLCLVVFLGAPALAVEPMADSKQPINITADKLEVLQPAQKAIFTGNVVAVQGATTLKSDRMTVFYRNNDKKGATKPAAAPAPSGQNSVQRIEVDGNVHVLNDTENATGDKGNYDVDKKTITLTGDVVLHRDKNVLKGQSLVYNLDTGQSLLNAGGSKPTKDAAANGRVQGVFFPQNSDSEASKTVP